MPNRRYDRGAALERAWCAAKREEGYVVGRIAGSRGAFDAFAAKVILKDFGNGISFLESDGIDLILAQMKSGGIHTFDGFSPSSRLALGELAAQAGGRAVLVRKRTRQVGYTEHYENEWPL